MTKEYLAAKVDPSMKAYIEDLVERGEVASLSEYVNQALLFYRNRKEMISQVRREIQEDEIQHFINFLQSKEGKALVRSLCSSQR